MPSFDIVSEADLHEVRNAVDNANRVLETRFDFRGVEASFEFNDNVIIVRAEGDFQLKQMRDVLRTSATKRGLDAGYFEAGDIDITGKNYKQTMQVKNGIEQDMAKKIVKAIKDAKLKVQAQIQGDKVRVTGKKRDDLQGAIALIKSADLGQPFQYNNFRD
jgi:uncharacterized protein YajQ (UPF0234 family)